MKREPAHETSTTWLYESIAAPNTDKADSELRDARSSPISNFHLSGPDRPLAGALVCRRNRAG